MTVKVKFKGDKIKVQVGEGYCPNVKDLLILLRGIQKTIAE